MTAKTTQAGMLMNPIPSNNQPPQPAMSDPIHIYLVIWLTLVVGITIGVYANERMWAAIPWAVIIFAGGLLTCVIVMKYALIGLGVIHD